MNEFESSVLKDSPSEFPTPISGSKASADGIISHYPKFSPSSRSLPKSSAATFGSDEYLLGFDDSFLLECETIVPESNLALIDDFMMGSDSSLPESSVVALGVDPGMVFDNSEE